jgi:hypothetical protein
MLHLILDDKEISIPSNYGELTYNQFDRLLKLSNPDDFLSIVSVLSNRPKEEWELCPDINADISLYESLKYLEEPFTPIFIKPDKIKIKSVLYDLPGGIAVNTLGQKLALQRCVTKAEKDGTKEVELYPYIVALYMQPIVTQSPYNEDKVEALVNDIKECQLQELFPIAGFFLKSCVTSSKKKKKGYPILLLKKKSEPGSIALKSSESYQRFGLFRGLLIRVLKRFFWKSTASFT